MICQLRQAVAPGQLHMLQPVINGHGHLNEFSWLAVLLGYPILGIWYWCADQTHVQRVLGAHTLKDGQNGALFAGFLKLSPVFLMVFPGVIGYVLWQQGAIHLGGRVDRPPGLQHHAAADDSISDPGRCAWVDRRQPGCRADELHGGGAQQLRNPHLDRCGQADSRRQPTPKWCGWAESPPA